MVSLDRRQIAEALIEWQIGIESFSASRPVFSDPLTAGLKPASNGETTAQWGMINDVPAIRF